MRRTFTTLDGLRGAAALVVMILHVVYAYAPTFNDSGSSYLAVDMFFLLSGFVIGHAYDAKLLAGMGFARFAKIRIIRLYPLYLLGLCLAVATPVILALASHELWHARRTVQALPWAVFMLPLPSIEPTFWWQDNPPRWSLFYEMIGNLAYALFARQLSNRMLAIVCVAAGSFIMFVSFSQGSLNLHPYWQIWAATSFARMAFSFTAGLLLYRWWRDGVLPAPRCPALLTIPMFLLLIAVPSSGPLAGVATAATVLLGFPLILMIGVANEPSSRIDTSFRGLGRISYALYVLHWPIIDALAALARAIGISASVGQIAALPVSIAAAWAATRYYDEPVRAWLQQRVTRRSFTASARVDSAVKSPG